jgi:serine/threonine-protein kinase
MRVADIEALLAPDETERKLDAVAKVGTLLDGKWHLDRLIAIGGWGAVYEATHRNGIRGAVKVLDPCLTISHEARQRFLREGRLANRVQHPGVVRVLDDDEAEDGTVYLVMELLEGSTLEQLATRSPGGRLDMQKAFECGIQIAETLSEAHASGVVHRDIKPENLLLTNDGIVKLLDFGIAASVNGDRSPRLTRSGAPIGTPAFMAPEQARGQWELVDHQSDIFSLGASLFTLLTGTLVNEAETVAQMLVLTMSRKSPSLAELLPDAPEAVVRAIDGALEIEKSKRWSSADAMRDALEEGARALANAPPSSSKIRIAPVATPERAFTLETTLAERRLPKARWLVSVAVAIIFATVVGSIAAPRASTHKAAASSTASVATTLTPVETRRYDPIYDQRF